MSLLTNNIKLSDEILTTLRLIKQVHDIQIDKLDINILNLFNESDSTDYESVLAVVDASTRYSNLINEYNQLFDLYRDELDALASFVGRCKLMLRASYFGFDISDSIDLGFTRWDDRSTLYGNKYTERLSEQIAILSMREVYHMLRLDELYRQIKSIDQTDLREKQVLHILALNCLDLYMYGVDVSKVLKVFKSCQTTELLTYYNQYAVLNSLLLLIMSDYTFQQAEQQSRLSHTMDISEMQHAYDEIFQILWFNKKR